MSVSINGTSGVVFNDASVQNTAATGFGFKNRLINSAMQIDQRNAGASVTPTVSGTYTLDRWNAQFTVASKFSVEQTISGVSAPAGFTDYFGCTSLSAYSVLTGDTFLIQQSIEGFNSADLSWGTASAATVTLSFWVRSSLTGTFGGSLLNNGQNRSYPFSYTISTANTWEQKSITIAGDTTGTWVGATNGIGIRVGFNLGSGATYSGTAGAWAATAYYAPTGATSVVGTSGATFYITGVQLEKGSTATSFDYRPYGTELMLCQRYYYKTQPPAANQQFGIGSALSGTTFNCFVPFLVPMRTNPTALEVNGTPGNYAAESVGAAAVVSAGPTFYRATTVSAIVNATTASFLTAGQVVYLRCDSTSAFLAWSAEL